MRYLFLILSLALLAACSSEEPAPDPAPEVAAAPAVKPQAKAKKKRRRRTKKGSSKKKRQRPAKAIPEGHVYVAFNKADLKSQVLPVIERQVGIKITWLGSRRQVNLPLKRTLPFAEAMDLICRFSDTHLVKAYTGRYELRDGYQGQLESDGLTLDTSNSSGQGRRSRRKRAGKASGRPVARKRARASGKAPSSSNDGWRDTYDAASGRRSGQEAKGILRDLGTRSTGKRGR